MTTTTEIASDRLPEGWRQETSHTLQNMLEWSCWHQDDHDDVLEELVRRSAR